MSKTETKNSRTATGEYYDGEVETIVYLESLATALIRNGVEPKRAHNIVAATKYLSSRLGAKADQPIELDLMKAENYIHRARTGKWIPKERLDPFGEERISQQQGKQPWKKNNSRNTQSTAFSS